MNVFNFFIVLLFSLPIFSTDIQMDYLPQPDFSFLLQDLVDIDN